MLIALIALVAVLVLPHFAFAQETSATSVTGQIEDVYKKMITFLVAITQFLQSLIWPVLLLIGGLLKNDILFSAGMEETMLSIWGNIRNIVNILFVIVLLAIAFYNVVGGSNDEYKMKTILPKFVIALIAVNFSFLGVKLVVDSVSVITTALFALPGAVERDLETTDSFEKQFCEGLYGKTDYFSNIKEVPEEDRFCGGEQGASNYARFTDKAKNFFTKYDSHNAAIVLAINMAEIGNLDVVKGGAANASLSKLTINIIFSIVFYIVYTIAFVVLLIVLLIRLVVLWVTMVMSPLIVLTFVLPESLKSAMGSGNEMGKQFVQNAIAPIPIALVMSIGFIMLQSLKQAQFSNVSLDTSTLQVNMLTSGLSTLQDVVAAVAMVVVIWMGVFAATKGTFAEGITNKIKDVTEGFGKFLATAPIKYAPIIPVYTGKEGEPPVPVSIAGAMGALQQYPHAKDEEAQRETQKILGIMGSAGAQDAIEEVEKAKDDKAFMQALINNQSAWNNPAFQKKAAEMLRNNRNWRLDFSSLKDDKGNPIKKDDFIKQLSEGKADKNNIDNFIKENKKNPRFSGLTREEKPDKKAEDAAKLGGAAAAGAIAAATADERISRSDANQRAHALSPDQQQKIEAYRNDQEKLGESQEALTALSEEMDAAHKFRGQLSDALAGKEEDRGTAIDNAIRQHRKGLVERMTKRNIPAAEAEKRANEIIERDLAEANLGENARNSQEYKSAIAPANKNASLHTPVAKVNRAPAKPTGGKAPGKKPKDGTDAGGDTDFNP